MAENPQPNHRYLEQGSAATAPEAFFRIGGYVRKFRHRKGTYFFIQLSYDYY